MRLQEGQWFMRLQCGQREDDTCRGMRIDMMLKHGIAHMRMWHGKKGVP